MIELNYLYIDQFGNTYYVKGNIDRPPGVVRYNKILNQWVCESNDSYKLRSPHTKEMEDDLKKCYLCLGQNK